MRATCAATQGQFGTNRYPSHLHRVEREVRGLPAPICTGLIFFAPRPFWWPDAPPIDALITGSVRDGDVLTGRYRIDRLLGAGGMGVVVAAHHLHLDEHVAIKFLLPEVLDNPEIVGRFSREARAAIKIESEPVARMIDVGSIENGAPHIVMEYQLRH